MLFISERRIDVKVYAVIKLIAKVNWQKLIILLHNDYRHLNPECCVTKLLLPSISRHFSFCIIKPTFETNGKS